MSRLTASLVLDTRVQARNQLYTIGIFIAVLFGFAIRFLIPEAHLGRAITGFVIVGLGATTSLFGASMLLLEKGERTLDALQTTMITTRDYLVSKAVTLTAFATLEVLIVALISLQGTPVNLPLLVLGVAMLGLFNTFLGLGLAAPFDSITRFLLPTASFWGLILQLPILTLLNIGPWWLGYPIPSQPAMLLVLAAFEPLQPWQWAYALIGSPLTVLWAYFFCRARFRSWIQFPSETT